MCGPRGSPHGPQFGVTGPAAPARGRRALTDAVDPKCDRQRGASAETHVLLRQREERAELSRKPVYSASQGVDR